MGSPPPPAPPAVRQILIMTRGVDSALVNVPRDPTIPASVPTTPTSAWVRDRPNGPHPAREPAMQQNTSFVASLHLPRRPRQLGIGDVRMVLRRADRGMLHV